MNPPAPTPPGSLPDPSAEPAEIRTERLRLIQSDLPLLDLLLAGPATFAAATGLKVAEGYLEFPEALPHSREQLATLARDHAWWAPWLFVHTDAETLIGLGGFKGPPDATGFVEFGYGIAPAWRGQGYATEAAAALMSHARRQPGVTAVGAHTLPEANASTRVLAKCGLVRVAELEDPVDGRIWRWELPRGE